MSVMRLTQEMIAYERERLGNAARLLKVASEQLTQLAQHFERIGNHEGERGIRAWVLEINDLVTDVDQAYGESHWLRPGQEAG